MTRRGLFAAVAALITGRRSEWHRGNLRPSLIVAPRFSNKAFQALSSGNRLDLIPKIYDRPGRVARIIGEDGDEKTVPLIFKE
jgi:hypothetical protein